MKICRFVPRHAPAGASTPARVGLVRPEGALLDLDGTRFGSVTALVADPRLRSELAQSPPANLPVHPLADVVLLPPVARQEVWAAGVTYLRSKAARMEESDFSATAYDRVYVAPRPELFFKSQPEKLVGPEDAVGVRRDSRWTVPEPELALVLSPRGEVAGFTIGNDMSARDIEGENLLYLPQAKTYERSCALGPWIEFGADEATARGWTIGVDIHRGGRSVFAGITEVGRIKRGFDELAEWLFRCQRFPAGAVLLTGTGVVPPDDFSLQAGDRVVIEVSGIGRLGNPVVAV
jgi:2-dehydro-3-deoxy-D-arabinonate dehydratase